jgi:hypothetical protein
MTNIIMGKPPEKRIYAAARASSAAMIALRRVSHVLTGVPPGVADQREVARRGSRFPWLAQFGGRLGQAFFRLANFFLDRGKFNERRVIPIVSRTAFDLALDRIAAANSEAASRKRQAGEAAISSRPRSPIPRGGRPPIGKSAR